MGLALALSNSMCQTSWNADQLANLSAWWDASTLTAGAIASMADLSGNGNAATNAGGAASPTATAAQQNGLTGLVFNGTSNLIKSSFTLTFPCTIFLAFKMARPASASHDIPFDGANVTSLTACLANDNTPEYYMYGGALFPSTPIAADLAVNGAVVACLFKAGASQLWVNEVLKASGADPGLNRGTPNGIIIGCAGNSGRFAAMTFLEMFVVNGASSADELSHGQRKLRSKWAI
jgi:hypothetical protein